MEAKKKLKNSLCHYGITLNVAISFMLVLGLQMIFSSTCLALTPISDFSLEDYTLALQRCYDDWDNFYDMNSTKKTWLYNTIHSSSNMTSTFNTLKNKLLSTDIQYVEQISVTMNSNYIYFILNNNTIGNSLPHIEISQQYGGSYLNYYVRCIDDSKNYVNFTAFCVDIANAQSSIVNQNLTNGNAIQVRMKTSYPFSFVSGSSVFGSNGFYNLRKVGNFYLNPNTTVSYSAGYYWNTNDYVINYQEPEPEPEQPSGDSSGDIGGSGTITNPSGDITGSIDLTGIENGIGQINGNLENIENKIPSSGDITNAISGEVGKITDTLTSQPNLSGTVITSGDIESSLNFDFMADPYENFWFSMTTGLSGSLTNTVRQIPIDWLGYQGVFDLDSLNFNYPTPLKNILTVVSTVSMVWLLVKWWKIIVDKLTSGNVDEVLQMNEEEGIVDLF